MTGFFPSYLHVLFAHSRGVNASSLPPENFLFRRSVRRPGLFLEGRADLRP